MGGEEVRLKTNCVRTAIALELYVEKKKTFVMVLHLQVMECGGGNKATCEPGMFNSGHQEPPSCMLSRFPCFNALFNHYITSSSSAEVFLFNHPLIEIRYVRADGNSKIC